MAQLSSITCLAAALTVVGIVAATCSDGDNFDPDTGQPCGSVSAGAKCKCERPTPLLALASACAGIMAIATLSKWHMHTSVSADLPAFVLADDHRYASGEMNE